MTNQDRFIALSPIEDVSGFNLYGETKYQIYTGVTEQELRKIVREAQPYDFYDWKFAMKGSGLIRKLFMISDMPYNVRVSRISGNGAFATMNLDEGEIVGTGFYKVGKTRKPDKDFVRSILGQFTNHSDTPNLTYRKIPASETYPEMYVFETLIPIKRETELTIDYRTFDFEGERKFTRIKGVLDRWIRPLP